MCCKQHNIYNSHLQLSSCLRLFQVTASFSFAHQSDLVPLLESEFSCDVCQGTVLPGESLQASVTYTPAVVETISVEHFHLKCSGALGETRLKVTGRCEGQGRGWDCKNKVPVGGIFFKLYFLS